MIQIENEHILQKNSMKKENPKNNVLIVIY